MDIKVINVSKKINEKIILDNVSLNIREGDIFSLLGPNGAGKTTLIRIILDLYKPTKGKVLVGNTLVTTNEYNKVRYKIGFLLDNIGLFKDLTAWENIEFFDRIYNSTSTSQDRKDRITKLLKKVDLYNHKNEAITFFSRGMKQRLALARSIVNNPSLLILDEPSRGLDVEGQFFLKELIMELKNKGCTLFINSHNLIEVEKVISNIGFIKNGKIIYSGSYNELKESFNENIYILKVDNIGSWINELEKAVFINVININGNEIMLHLKNDVSELSSWLNKHNIEITELKKSTNNLEDIYSKILN